MMVSIDASLEAAVRRDRLVVIAAQIAVITIAWTYLLAGAGMGMSALEMTRMSQLWTAGYAILMFFMWWVMMVAADAAQRGTDDHLIRDCKSKSVRSRPSPCQNEHIHGRRMALCLRSIAH